MDLRCVCREHKRVSGRVFAARKTACSLRCGADCECVAAVLRTQYHNGEIDVPREWRPHRSIADWVTECCLEME